jgi:gamma-glutamyltranspeptidase/glutathione hydrolase
VSNGAIASGCPYSAQVGSDILATGGNAVDAVVGAALVSSFTLPTMTGLGGGGVLTMRMGDQLTSCDFFAALPGLGHQGTKMEPEVIVVPFEGVRLPFKVGTASVAVPGYVSGIWAVHERYGRMPLAEVVAPAIDLARTGVLVTEAQHRTYALLEATFRRTPETWALIGRRDHVLEEGDTLRNPPLAQFFEALIEEGPDLFYRGEVAKRIEEVTDGYVTGRDLAEYSPAWDRPLSLGYGRSTVHTLGRPSFNGVLLLRALAELESGADLPPFGEVAYWSRIADAMRSSEVLRTPDFESQVFDDGFLAGVAANCPGGNTLHISAVDADHNAVGLTTTVGEGAGFAIPGTGIALNNFLGEGDIFPDHVTHVPGRRMMTGMAPTLVEGEAGGILVLGSAGSARIRSAILQVIVHVIDSGLDLGAAVLAPRVHPDGDTIYIESHGRTPEQVEELHQLGKEAIMTYEVGFFFGGVQAARWDPVHGFTAGAETERRGGAAMIVS